MTDDPPRRLPLLVFDGREVWSPAIPDPLAAPRIGTAGRMELLAAWDGLSQEGRRALLVMARALVEEERQE